MSNETISKPEFYLKLDSLLNLPAGSVKGEQSLSGLANWDSLAILEFMILASSDYGSNVQPSDIAACETVDELAQITMNSIEPGS